MRSVVGKIMWVGRATVFLVGLAVMLALVLGVATSAFGANNDNFILGALNNTATAVTRLSGNVSGGPALQVVNPDTAAGSKALQLKVADNNPPLAVNPTAGKATNLNADKVDGHDAPLWAAVNYYGALARTNGATSSSRTSTGDYRVVFSRNVGQCAYTATLGGHAGFFEPNGTVQVTGGGDSNGVKVHTTNLSGTEADRGFFLSVNC